MGCGSDGDPGELIRYETWFGEAEPGAGPKEPGAEAPSLILTVREDGSAVYERSGERPFEFQVSEAELTRVRADLDQIDFEEARNQLEGKSGRPFIRLTFEGSALEIGSVYTTDFTQIFDSPVYAALKSLERLIDKGDPPPRRTPTPGLPIDTPAEFEAGERVATQAGCLACHSFGSAGNPGPGPDLTHIGSELSRAKIERAVTNGPGVMPSYQRLGKDEPEKLDALTDFLSALR